MADRWDDDRDRNRSAEAWRERDERWGARDEHRPFSERASDQVRSWFGDEEARRRREMDEGTPDRGPWRERSGRERERFGRHEGSSREYGREGGTLRSSGWERPEYGTTYERDRSGRRDAPDLTRERDFGRSDRYANVDEGMSYGYRTFENRPGGYERSRESYRGTSGYETGRGAGSFGSWGRIEDSRRMSSSPAWESGPYVGRGPRGYQRADERIREEICERLTRHGRIDATDIEIRVAGGEVTLEGSVNDRESKRLAEDVAESVFGVKDVNNHIKVYREEYQPVGTTGRRDFGEQPSTAGSTRTVTGLAGTANTPEITPPDREEPRKA